MCVCVCVCSIVYVVFRSALYQGETTHTPLYFPTHTHTYVHACTCTHMYTNTYIHTYTYMYVHNYTHMCLHTTGPNIHVHNTLTSEVEIRLQNCLDTKDNVDQTLVLSCTCYTLKNLIRKMVVKCPAISTSAYYIHILHTCTYVRACMNTLISLLLIVHVHHRRRFMFLPLLARPPLLLPLATGPSTLRPLPALHSDPSSQSVSKLRTSMYLHAHGHKNTCSPLSLSLSLSLSLTHTNTHTHVHTHTHTHTAPHVHPIAIRPPTCLSGPFPPPFIQTQFPG